MTGLGEAVLEAVLGADAVEEVPKGPGLVAPVAKPGAVVGSHRVHPARQLGQYAPQKPGGQHFCGLRRQPGKGPFAGAVDGHKRVLAAFFGLHFGKIDG